MSEPVTPEDVARSIAAQMLIPANVAMTEEQADEFRQRFTEAMNKPGAWQQRVLPPWKPSPEQVRDWLRENVTVVKPGETLVIQAPDLTPNQMREFSDWLNWRSDDGTPILPFRTVVVPGTGLGVAEATP